MRERQKQGGSDEPPTVTVETRKSDESVEVRVRDNGVGIPVTQPQ